MSDGDHDYPIPHGKGQQPPIVSLPLTPPNLPLTPPNIPVTPPFSASRTPPFSAGWGPGNGGAGPRGDPAGGLLSRAPSGGLLSPQPSGGSLPGVPGDQASLSSQFATQVDLNGGGNGGGGPGSQAAHNGGGQAAEGDAAAAGAAPEAPPPASVLIVDDDNINVKVLQRAFVKVDGFKVTTGEDGQDMVRLLVNQNMRFDVVLLDENMRHMNGSTATIELRKHEVGLYTCESG
jgi:hypothetical protein